ncbi:MAG: enoyl-CoA hydratase/isomerase family protein [Hyphomicrobiaceae bacterium]
MPDPIALSPTDIRIDRSNADLAVVVIDRAKRRNAMTRAMWQELHRVFDELGQSPDVRAIILTGAGGAFCAGADIAEFPAVRATVEDGRAYEAAVDQLHLAIAASPKPTVAAISGPCFGGGVALALSCDFRVADATAYFAIPAARLSNVYGVVETRVLFDAVGLATAKEVLFTGRRYDASEAYRVGLATHLASSGTALDAAVDFAKAMRTSAPLTITGAKVVLDAISRNMVDQRHAAIHEVMDAAISSEDYKEGVAAFAAKRDPVFKGR